MSTLIIRGTMGSTVNLNSPIVNFNLTADPETHKVHGSVEITLGNPGDKPYKGNVTGTLYATGFKQFVKVISLNGYIPSNNPITPIEFGFNANMGLEADGEGVAGFNFKGQHFEELPVTYKIMEL
ncbi:hypothetical protein KORDIASMS9_03934 [Kordia sp. SMS9]|uniref:DUF1842 domain-containing protein n=1 Tax=Kordia sp. SMS9 TaxID=2282170 RepID=UPI000E101D00|nr:DUF1842 domain-containing protein [Kordia sp. SMS9]AXG71677.1 hypothetical protein KORDIASMS9_03934 [Kordia sp. SMS9]